MREAVHVFALLGEIEFGLEHVPALAPLRLYHGLLSSALPSI